MCAYTHTYTHTHNTQCTTKIDDYNVADLSAPFKRKELRLATKLRILLAKGPSSAKSIGRRSPWPGGKKMVRQQVSDMTANMSEVNIDL